MRLSERFTRNLGSSWAGMLVHLATVMVLTPFVLRELGGSRFGVWALLTTITGYYGLLDAGARVSIARNITRYHATGDWKRMNRAASAGLATLLTCAAAILLITVVFAAIAESLFYLPSNLVSEFRWCILIVGASVAVLFCFFVHSAALGAMQRYDLTNASDILTHLLYACGVPFILIAGGGLLGLALWLGLTNLLSYAIRWRMARRVLPELQLSLRLVNRAGLREFASLGVWQLLVNLAKQVIACSDAIVIAATVNTTAVAPFYVAGRVARHFARVFNPIGDVLFPAIVHLDAVGSPERIRLLYIRGTRLLWTLSIGLAFVAMLWCREFFALWIGERQAGFEGRLSELFIVLLMAAVVTAPQQIGLPALLALAPRVLAALLAAEAVTNVALSLLLVRPYGLLGIAWGTCIPALLFQGIAHPLVTCRLLEVNVDTYFREGLGRPLLVACVLAALSLLRPGTIVDGWLALVTAGACTIAVVAVVGAVFGLDRTERERFIFAIAKRLSRASALLRREQRPSEQPYVGPATRHRPTRDATAPELRATTGVPHD